MEHILVSKLRKLMHLRDDARNAQKQYQPIDDNIQWMSEKLGKLQEKFDHPTIKLKSIDDWNQYHFLRLLHEKENERLCECFKVDPARRFAKVKDTDTLGTVGGDEEVDLNALMSLDTYIYGNKVITDPTFNGELAYSKEVVKIFVRFVSKQFGKVEARAFTRKIYLNLLRFYNDQLGLDISSDLEVCMFYIGMCDLAHHYGLIDDSQLKSYCTPVLHMFHSLNHDLHKEMSPIFNVISNKLPQIQNWKRNVGS